MGIYWWHFKSAFCIPKILIQHNLLAFSRNLETAFFHSVSPLSNDVQDIASTESRCYMEWFSWAFGGGRWCLVNVTFAVGSPPLSQLETSVRNSEIVGEVLQRLLVFKRWRFSHFSKGFPSIFQVPLWFLGDRMALRRAPKTSWPC